MKGAEMAPILEMTNVVPVPVLRRLVGNISACCMSTTIHDAVTANLTSNANTNETVEVPVKIMPKSATMIIDMNMRNDILRPLERSK